jgi:hypothetical protein
MGELASWLLSDWEAIPAGSEAATLKLALALCKASDDADAGAGAALADRFFWIDEGAATVDWLKEEIETLPPQVRARCRELCAEALAGDRRNLSEEEVGELLQAFPADDQVELKRDAVRRAIGAERPEVAGALLKGLKDVEQEEILSEALAQAESGPASHLAEARFLAAQRARVDEGRLFAIAMGLAQAAFDERGSVTQFAPVIEKLEFADAERRLQLVEHLITTERDMTDPENREAILRAAWGAAGRRPSKAREAISGRLQEVRDGGEEGVATVAAELLDSA